MRDLRVLHIIQTPLDYISGPTTYVKEISRHLSIRGVKVGIIVPASSRLPRESSILSNRYGVNLYFVKPSLWTPLIRTPFVYSLKAHKLIANVIREYDVINVHVEAALLQGFTRLFDNKRLFLTVHGIYPFEDIETLKNDLFNTYRLAHLVAISPQHVMSLKRLSIKSEHVIPVSKFLAKLLVCYYQVSEEKIVVIPNSVDVETFKPQPSSRAMEIVNKILISKGYRELANDEKIVLFIGRLEPRKGLHILLKALRILNDKSWSLIVIGDGSTRYIKMCLNLAKRYNIWYRTFFIGKVPEFMLKYLYSSAYVYVLPSMFEGLPTSILESMACGTPVIATRVSGIPEVVKNNVTGLLIIKPDPLELAKTLELILADENLRKRLSVNGLNYVRKHFSWHVNVERYIELVNKEGL